MQIQTDEEAIHEAVHEFVDKEIKMSAFTEKLADYIVNIRSNAYKEGYAAGQANK